MAKASRVAARTARTLEELAEQVADMQALLEEVAAKVGVQTEQAEQVVEPEKAKATKKK